MKPIGIVLLVIAIILVAAMIGPVLSRKESTEEKRRTG